MIQMSSPPFLISCSTLNGFKWEEIIVGGDFNLVLDVDKDKNRLSMTACSLLRLNALKQRH